MKLPTTNYKLQTTNKGVSLYLALMIMFILIAIGLGISLIIVSQMKMIRGMSDSVVAFYAADTGIEEGLYKKRIEGTLESGDSFPGSVGGASYEGAYEENLSTGEYKWKSVGSYLGTKRAIEIIASIPLHFKLTLTCAAGFGNICGYCKDDTYRCPIAPIEVSADLISGVSPNVVFKAGWQTSDPGCTLSFSPLGCDLSCSSQLTIDCSSPPPAGNYSLEVSADPAPDEPKIFNFSVTYLTGYFVCDCH
jgi:hypothetical protein